MKALGMLIMLPGILLLTGEYLCVEVAWRCMDYNVWVTSLGALMLGVGLIAVMLAVDDN